MQESATKKSATGRIARNFSTENCFSPGPENRNTSRSPLSLDRTTMNFKVVYGDVYGSFLNAAENRAAVDVLIAHIKSEPDLIRAKDENGNTVLHLASRNGHLQIVEILCQVVFAV